MKKIKRAIISISDKKKLEVVLKVLKKYKIKILSSGGTYKEIIKLGFDCEEISNFTNSPEILNGRVKTLHPKIHAGILNIRNKKHQKEMKRYSFQNIDLVIVNLYPFEKTLDKTNNKKIILENIDIGGSTLIRAAAKNYNNVCVISNSNQYESLVNELEKHRGSSSLEFREKMAEEAFGETAYYDAVISNYFNNKLNNLIPKKKLVYGNLIENLRYGENPHQKAGIYSNKSGIGISQLHGKKLSYNNYNDIFSALKITKTLPNNLGTVIVKHANPCGVSIIKNKVESFRHALECDPVSAFGGVVACNYKITKKLSKELNKIFLEIVIGNGFEKDALKILKKKKNIRIINSSNLKKENKDNIITNFNATLVQTSDNKKFQKKDFKVVSNRKPNIKTLNNLIFAFNICRNVKSNAIVLSNEKTTIGIGSGQPSRLDSCKIAIEKMKKFQKNINLKNIVAASDAFFPFIDGIETLIQAGVSAIVQPSGSIRDKEIINFANKMGIILIFANSRHFKH